MQPRDTVVCPHRNPFFAPYASFLCTFSLIHMLHLWCYRWMKWQRRLDIVIVDKRCISRCTWNGLLFMEATFRKGQEGWGVEGNWVETVTHVMHPRLPTVQSHGVEWTKGAWVSPIFYYTPLGQNKGSKVRLLQWVRAKRVQRYGGKFWISFKKNWCRAPGCTPSMCENETSVWEWNWKKQRLFYTARDNKWCR